jgi:hypothetical protein
MKRDGRPTVPCEERAADRATAGALDNPEPGTQMTIWTSSAPSWAAFEPGIPLEPKQAPPPEPKG